MALTLMPVAGIGVAIAAPMRTCAASPKPKTRIMRNERRRMRREPIIRSVNSTASVRFQGCAQRPIVHSRKCDGIFLTLAAHCPDGRATSLGSSCCIWILDNHIEHHRLVRWWSGWGLGVGGTGERQVTKGAPALVVRAPPRREYRPIKYNRLPVFACYLQARPPAEPTYGPVRRRPRTRTKGGSGAVLGRFRSVGWTLLRPVSMRPG
jgi:hypothetical protein